MVCKQLVWVIVPSTAWLYVLNILNLSKSQEITLTISKGTLLGRKLTYEGKTYFEFLGIPYAQPPVGSLRFQTPKPASSWEGVRSALEPGSRCPQFNISGEIIGNEDCLYINVYTPELPQTNVSLKAVMVNIHGGGFLAYHGYTYGPERLLPNDVLLVTFNYRLSILGFLSLENCELPGNFGLKDQVLALRWVQENIASFGGDPNNVTIFGESGGAASVHYMILSKQAEGLFHKAIMQSGTSLNVFAYKSKPRETALKVAQVLGVNSSCDEDLYALFMNESMESLLAASQQVHLEQYEDVSSGFTSTTYAPCAEVTDVEDAFITQSPREILESGQYTKVPMIVGSTDGEGVVLLYMTKKLSQTDFVDINSNSSWTVPTIWNITDEDEKHKIENALKLFYFHGQNISWSTISKYTDLYTELFFYLDIKETLTRTIQQSSCPIYTYQFTLQLQNSFKQVAMIFQEESFNITGSSHQDDVIVLFNYRDSLINISYNLTESEMCIAKRMARLWTNFAKTGNPNDNCLEVNWQPMTENECSYLKIDNSLSIVSGIVREEQLNVWTNLCQNSSSTFPCEIYL